MSAQVELLNTANVTVMALFDIDWPDRSSSLCYKIACMLSSHQTYDFSYAIQDAIPENTRQEIHTL